MITPATSIGVGTLFLAIIPVALNVRLFFKNGRDPKVFLRGFQGVIIGITLTMCAGGVLGWLASVIAGGGNGASAVVPWATGTQDRDLASSDLGGLTIEGGGVALTIAALGFVAIRATNGTNRRRLLGGLFVGVVLPYTAGVGGLVDAQVIPAYNTVGSTIVNAVSGVWS